MPNNMKDFSNDLLIKYFEYQSDFTQIGTKQVQDHYCIYVKLLRQFNEMGNQCHLLEYKNTFR